MTACIRKLAVVTDQPLRELGRDVDRDVCRAVAMAVIDNPFANRFVQELEPLMAVGEQLGAMLAEHCIAALGPGAPPDAFGKAAIVGEGGELEHAAAILHPRMGAPLRTVLGGGPALVPSSKSIGGPGWRIDVPLGHKDAAYVRSHFDAINVGISDAPGPAEILVAVAIASGGRPFARVGGLTTDQISGEDGLR